MATATETTEQTATVREAYDEKFIDWCSSLWRRLMLYTILVILTAGQMLILTELFASDILTEGEEAFQFLYNIAGLLLLFLIAVEGADGLKYAFVKFAGKHRAFLGLAVAMSVGAAALWTRQVPATGEHAEAYQNLAEVLALVLGIRFADAGLYKSDFENLRDLFPGGESA